ncbi:MAG: fibrobacter succinogenes major paralogous domain-containing protein, partial [Bacteroidetes bacterium]|nr:fibrobacter succinogenes major paralogous domain-containing protein [Bacteroidota bacterium]
NLLVSKFKNGDAILKAKTKAEWVNANQSRTPACCCFKFIDANCQKYGMLYNWYAAVDSRGLAPEGWRVPSDQDFTKLTTYLGGPSKAGHKLKSKKGWYYNSSGINGSNSSKFNGSATGEISEIGWFYAENQMAYYWSTTPGPSNNAYGLGLWRHSKTSRRPLYPQGYGFAIRCIKN